MYVMCVAMLADAGQMANNRRNSMTQTATTTVVVVVVHLTLRHTFAADDNNKMMMMWCWWTIPTLKCTLMAFLDQAWGLDSDWKRMSQIGFDTILQPFRIISSSTTLIFHKILCMLNSFFY